MKPGEDIWDWKYIRKSNKSYFIFLFLFKGNDIHDWSKWKNFQNLIINSRFIDNKLISSKAII